jgi:uncharacterized protein YcnI
MRTSAAVAAGVVLATVVIPAGPASAHVSVSPAQAAQGGFAVLAFRVPNERESAATTKVQLYFPTGTPIIGATVRQTLGWKAQVERGQLPAPVTVDGKTLTNGVLSITWTAQDGADPLTGSDYQEFGVSLGPLPKADRVVFKALQTYNDGEVVRWIEEPVDGQDEPEHPAVVLRLTAGGEALDAHGMPIGTTGQATSSSAQVARQAAPSSVALAIAVAALVIAVAALVFTLIGRRPRQQHPDTPDIGS